jgi:hypothetical protein
MTGPEPVVVAYRDIPGWPGYRLGSDGSGWCLKNTRHDRRFWRRLVIHRGRYYRLRRGTEIRFVPVTDLVALVFPEGVFRASPGPGGLGESNAKARLSEGQVIELRTLRDDDPDRWTYAALAARYGVHRQTIYHVLSGRTWSHLRPETPCGRRRPR